MVQVSRWPSAEGSDTLCGSRHAQLCISAARQQTDNITVAPNREYLKISEELISARSQARPKQMNKQNQNINLVSKLQPHIHRQTLAPKQAAFMVAAVTLVVNILAAKKTRTKK